MKDVTPTNIIEVNIETKGPPIKRKMYRLPQAHRDPLRRILDELLAANIIRPSTSCYCAPILLVKKKSGDYRLVVDFRSLNQNILNDNCYPLPRIEDIIDLIIGAVVFSSLDCHSGFFTLPITEKDKYKTAFICPFGLFEFNRLPQGLKISPSNFQMMMDTALNEVRFDCAKAFIDDCLVHSKKREEHLRDLEKTLKCIEKANIKLRPSKCEFFKEKITFLGHVISKDGIEIGEDRVKAILDISEPKTVTQVKSFLGVLNYFKDHIKNLQLVAEPLTKLTRKGQEFTFGEKEKEAFDTLKQLLCSAPILSFYDPQLKTQLHTDGSSVGIGVTLIQVEKDTNKERVVSYYSRVLTSSEKNLSAIEIELLAIVEGIKRFKHYLTGTKIEIITDSNPLTFLMRTRNLNSRLCRWSLFIQEFDFDIVYRKGKNNNVCDFLSRYPVNDLMLISDIYSSETEEILNDFESPEFSLAESFLIDSFLFDLNNISELQAKDKYLCKIIDVLRGKETGKNKSLRKAALNYEMKNGKLYRVIIVDNEFKNVLAIPKSIVPLILRSIHDCILSGGHLGIRKTFERAKSRFHWNTMFNDIVKWIQSCPICQKVKPNSQKSGKLTPIKTGSRPFSRVGFILVATCYLTKYAVTKAVKNVTARDVAKFLMHDIILQYSAFETLISDNGVQFRSKIIEELNNLLKSEHKFTTPYQPSTSGQVERCNRQIMQLIRTYIDKDVVGC
ncbi:pol polyprotein-like protein, partial [Dinothrombium tinctorium]